MTTSLSGAFVGRQREMDELKVALEEALSGQGRLLMLVGEPGIGKTRTAQELSAYAETRGAHVLWGWCYEEEGAPPFWPWVQPIRAYVQQRDSAQLQSEMGQGAADIAEVVSEVRGKLPGLEPPPALPPEQARFRLFDSITTFLKNAAQSQPLMLVLDDLHWADKSSLLLLQFLARQLGESHLLVVGCYRDLELSRQHPLSEALAQLSRLPVFQRKLLLGISQEDTGQFIELTARMRPSPQLVETIYARTEGNPFFLKEMTRLLSERGALGATGIGGPEGIRIPQGVREVIGQRLNRLSESCHQGLTIASVIGREFELKLLSFVSGSLSEEQLLAVLDEALAAHLIEELPGSAEGYQFCHVLIQEILASEISAARRARLHARIGEALEGLYGDNGEAHAAELAYHFARAEPVLGQEKLVRYSFLAGERALATYAWEEALAHFQRGLDAKEGQSVDAAVAALLFGLARAQRSTLGRYRLHEVVSTLRRAFDYYVAAGDVPGALAVAEYPFSFGRGGITGLLAEALKLVQPETRQAGRLLARYGRALSLYTRDHEGGLSILDQALAIAQREKDTALERRIFSTLADVHYYRLQFQESLENSLHAIELGRYVSQPQAEEDFLYLPHWLALRALIPLGDIEKAWGHAAAELMRVEKCRDRFSLAQALHGNSLLAHLQGNWQMACDFSDRALAVDDRDVRLLHNRAILEYQQGQFGEGAHYLERLVETMRLSPREPNWEHLTTPMTIGVATCISGTDNHADDALAAAEVVLSAPTVLPFHAQGVRTGLALLAVHRGDVASAGEQYAALTPSPITMTLMNLVCGHRVLGLLARTLGFLPQAMAHFEDALAFCRKAGCRPELAWACHDYAEALLQCASTSSVPTGSGYREKAMSLLNEALSISQELGMRPLLERVVTLQQRADSLPFKAPAYPEGLTQREVEVLRLVAAGRSSVEIAAELVLSRRTVERHISNIYNKTHTHNRTEATAFAFTHGLIPTG